MTIDFKPSGLGNVLGYKGVHALCTVSKDGNLKASHFVCVLIGGSKPIWGCWSVNGKWQRFFGGRAEIEKTYPQLVWKRKMASWGLKNIADKSVPERRSELLGRYGGEWPYAFKGDG